MQNLCINCKKKNNECIHVEKPCFNNENECVCYIGDKSSKEYKDWEKGQYENCRVIDMCGDSWITKDGLWITLFNRYVTYDLQRRGVKIGLIEEAKRDMLATIEGCREEELDLPKMCKNTLQFIEETKTTGAA